LQHIHIHADSVAGLPRAGIQACVPFAGAGQLPMRSSRKPSQGAPPSTTRPVHRRSTALKESTREAVLTVVRAILARAGLDASALGCIRRRL
jgi:hypothetical protein